MTGHDPPGRLAGDGVAGPVRFQEEYRLTGDGAATILTQSMAPPAARSGWPRACYAASSRSSSPPTSAGSRTWWKPRSRTADLRPQTACHHVPFLSPTRRGRHGINPGHQAQRAGGPASAVPGRLRQRRYASLTLQAWHLVVMVNHDPAAAVRRAVDAISDRSIGNRVAELLAPSFVRHDLAGLVSGSHGPEGASGFVTMITAAMPDFRPGIEDISSAGDRATVRLPMSGTAQRAAARPARNRPPPVSQRGVHLPRYRRPPGPGPGRSLTAWLLPPRRPDRLAEPRDARSR